MQNLLHELDHLLRQDERLMGDGGLIRNKIIELALQPDPHLLRLLLSHPAMKKHFFQPVDDVLVFDKVKFQKFINNKNFLPDSYTSYRNKLGLTVHDVFLRNDQHVVLSWPYKDCVLAGGQTRPEAQRQERFINGILAPDEVDRLFEPKALVEFMRHTSSGKQPVEVINEGENLLIKGNNLLTLHTLKSMYAGRIKLIYIDPPYNTGKDSFGYNDSFNHSTWLTFMKNRLEVARELLKPDGVMFISIDINEHAYLKVLCDEIFGRENFIGEIIWETATDNNATQISVEHEHVLCFARRRELQGKWQVRSDKAQHIQRKYQELKKLHGTDTAAIEKALRSWVNSMKRSNDLDLSGVSHYTYVDEKGVFYPGNSANTRPGGYTFDILHPRTKKVCRRPANGYRWPEQTFNEADARGDVLWGADEHTVPKIKKRLETATELLKGYFYEDNRKSTNELAALMGGRVFENPKSMNLLKKIVKFTTTGNDIILDFFAGSGTTAAAVLAVDREENSNRTFILCEQMDHVGPVTAARIEKCLGDRSFIYCELAQLNEKFERGLAQADTAEQLKEIWQSMKEHAILDPLLSIGKMDELLSANKDVALLKQLLKDVLDKNQLYVPYSEIADEDHGISKEDQRLCHQLMGALKGTDAADEL